MMKAAILSIVSFLLFSNAGYSSEISGKVINSAGKVFHLENYYYPKISPLERMSVIKESDTILSLGDSRAYVSFGRNKPAFINSNTSLTLKMLQLKSGRAFDVFLGLNYGKIKLFTPRTFVATPNALIETVSGQTIVIHNQDENFSRVMTLEGSAYVSRTRGVSKRVLLNAGESVDVYYNPGDVLEAGLIPKTLTGKESAEGNEGFDPNALMGAGYKPSFLDSIFRTIILYL
jgi:hypothetical protein